MTDNSDEYTIQCRYCRYVLQIIDATTTPHSKALIPRSTCGTVFLSTPEINENTKTTVSWLYESTLDKLEGVLECPKCRKKVGSFKWHGEMCSCGDWIVPCIGLNKSKVDVHKKR